MSRRFTSLIRSLVLLAGYLIVLSTLYARARAEGSIEPVPPRAPAVYFFDGALSANDRANIRRGVTDFFDYLASEAIPMPGFVAIYVLSDAHALAQNQHRIYRTTGFIDNSITVDHLERQWLAGRVGGASPGFVWIYSGATLWQQDHAFRVKLLAHELFHVVQRRLANGAVNLGPNWLLEGSAELIGYRSAIASKVYRPEQIAARWAWEVALTTVDLRDLESGSGMDRTGDRHWGLSTFATDYLVSGGGGVASLVTYYREIGLGRPWREAFLRAFRRTPDDFYASFRIYRERFLTSQAPT